MILWLRAPDLDAFAFKDSCEFIELFSGQVDSFLRKRFAGVIPKKLMLLSRQARFHGGVPRWDARTVHHPDDDFFQQVPFGVGTHGRGLNDV
ncbi:Glyoxylase or a related metal-dependent hydrolase [Pseudomonas syringae pv. actinidiae]|uniref:Glyoxylase or a related metal-dependent hydrolase n=1 Tax=Pseudomonas syringae pv. actinidiae TaxID=103796 RepID=A0A2V0QRU3_PSESF|nr:Glyoxylase or a related metal-dependent hydrolase [Pseudomonas syringae pv. actinidiae]